ncbi:beta-ketoacyl synthase N-terminal-like domain-containing protein [Saccharothrix saharensis]|uniref:beta-ketoacyl synthase N-terminal-like domain-containing protein n=1 Tax=Saccharothrix saharensis TaxID=571190 RepID=UPI003686EE00
MTDDGIAIVGMACRFPGAADVRRFWANLRAGVDSISRFAPDGTPHHVPARGVLPGGEGFDWPFFGYSPGEAARIDPQQRVFLECASAAVDDAGLDPARFDGLVGVFAGCDAAPLTDVRGGDDAAARIIGADKDFLATRVAYKLGLRGPALTVQTACSTSLVAVHLAVQGLLDFECDAALAGGVSLLLPQAVGYAYREGDILSRDGRCRPFDAQASGTVPSAGVGVVVLRRLADAIADGDHVVAVIRGSAVNNDGGGKIGYTAPSVPGQAAVIRLAQARADVTAAQVSYVEAHGTGTPVGDPIEVAALAEVFRGVPGPCRLGAVKSNIGHTGAAAGVAGVIKTALMLAHRELVPTAHFTRPNPELGLAGTPFEVAVRHEPWSGPLCAGVSSFGIGGTNAHVVLGAAPEVAVERSAGSRVLLVSAASPAALTALRGSLAGAVDDVGSAERTLAARRRFRYRAAHVVSGPSSAAEALRAPVDAVEAAERPRVAFLFPGQGALRRGIGRTAYERLPEFRRVVDSSTVDLTPLLSPEVDPEWLRDTEVQQVALFALGYGLAAQLRAWGVTPVAMLGNSVGEYVAATVAGLWTLPDAVALVAARGRAMREAPAGRMLAVFGDPGPVGPGLVVAVRSPGQVVVSGEVDAVAALEEELRRRGVACRVLDTGGAFHSPLMRDAAVRLREVLESTPTTRPRLPFVSNVTGGLADPDEVRSPEYWVRHLCAPVRLDLGVTALAGVPTVVELGPGTSMTRMVPGAIPLLGREPDDVLHAVGRLWERGVDVTWAGTGARKVPLPAHPFEPRVIATPIDLPGGLRWPAPVPSLASRPDLRARLARYCAGLLARSWPLAAGPLPRLAAFVRRTLAQEGWLTEDGLVADVGSRISGALAEHDHLGEVAGLRDLVRHCVESYPDVFGGRRDPVSVLFPDGDDGFVSAGYAANDIAVSDAEPCLAALAAAIRAGRVRRVLEVGAGRGDFAARLLTDAPDALSLSYHVTDVSPLRVRQAMDRLRPLAGRHDLRFSTLDITRLPDSLGTYDVVVAHNVVHVAPDLRRTLRGLTRFLTADGWLALVEVTRPDVWSHLIWGLAPGWWSATDGRDTPHLDRTAWLTALADVGLNALHATPPGNPDHTVLLATQAALPDQPHRAPSPVAVGSAGGSVAAAEPGRSAASTGRAYVPLSPAGAVPTAESGVIVEPGQSSASTDHPQPPPVVVGSAGGSVVATEPGRFRASTDHPHPAPSPAEVLSAPEIVGPLWDNKNRGPLGGDPCEASEGAAGRWADVLASTWCEVLGVGQVREADDFFRLGGESLMLVHLLGRVRDRTGVQVPLAALSAHATFGRLVELVELVHDTPTTPGLVPLNDVTDGVPLFLAAPGTGTSAAYRDLAARLDRPVLGLEPPGPLDTVEDVAAHHVDLVRRHHPEGPYLVGGWSTGVTVAHEMAHHLPAATLIGIDGHVPDTRGRALGTVPDIVTSATRHYVERGRPDVYYATIRAMLRYTPKPAPTHATLFLTEEAPHAAITPMYAHVDIRATPGDHWSALEPPHVDHLAAGIRQALNGAP